MHIVNGTRANIVLLACFCITIVFSIIFLYPLIIFACLFILGMDILSFFK